MPYPTKRPRTTRQPKTSAESRRPIRFSWSIDSALSRGATLPGVVGPDTLAQCIQFTIERGRLRMLTAALPKGAQITGATGRLLHVSDYAIEFSLHVRTQSGKHPIPFRLVAARNDRDRGDVLKSEIRNLTWLAPRLPKNAPAIVSSGNVFQPDRRGRSEMHRTLPAYLTRPLPEAQPCTFGNTDQLATGSPIAKLLTRHDTDHVRRRIVELCLRAFDPAARRAMPPPDIARGSLRLALQARSVPELWFTSCPMLWERLDAVTLLHRLAGFEWKQGNLMLPLLPPSHHDLLSAVTSALGKQGGRDLLTQYAAALEAGRFPEHRRFPRSAVSEILGESAA